MKADDYKKILTDIIKMMAKNPWMFANDPERDFTRKRKLPFDELLWLILTMGGKSIPKELRDHFPVKEERMYDSAFIQQRDKLLPETFLFMMREFNRRCGAPQKLHGFRVLAVDGSALNIACDPKAESYYEKQHFNQLQINALYDLLNQVYTDVVVQPRPKEDERKALSEMLKRNVRGEKTLVIADRGYESFAMFETFNRVPDAYYLIRIKNSGRKKIKDLPMTNLDIDMPFDVRTRKTNENKKLLAEGKVFLIPGESKYGKKKVQVTWPFPEEQCLIKTRIVRFPISEKNGVLQYETIATNLPRDLFNAKMIKELYGMRWGIETSFRDLKYTIGLVNLHSKKEEAIKLEIFAHMLFYNFCKRVALCARIKQTRKYFYVINFSYAVDIFRDFLRSNKIRGPNVEKDILEYILPVRPGRADKRKIMPKSYIPFAYRVA